MSYIVNGKVVEKKPFNIVDMFRNLFALIVLFFRSIFSSQTVDTHVNGYQAQRRGYGGSSGGSNIHRIAKPAVLGGCSGGG